MAAHSKLTDENVELILKRLRSGATNLEAIDGIIAESAFYQNLKDNTELAARVGLAKDSITETARLVVAQRVIRGDVPVSQWWLERRDKKHFSTRSELTGKDGDDLLPKPILGGTSVSKDGDAKTSS